MTIRSTRRTFLAGSAAAAGVLAMPAIARAQATTLRISHYVPPTHGIQVDLLEPWAAELKQRTGIDYEIHAVNSAFGRADRQADQVRAGIVDIAFGLAGIPRGRFPHTSVIELPFMVEDARAGSRALWQLYQDGDLGGEYDDFKILLLMTHHGGLFHTVNRPVRALEDLRGLRMRSPGPAVSAMLEYLGASAIGMPPAQIYESLQRGALDGLCTTWDLVGAIRANEVLKYHTDGRIYVAAFYTAMNQEKFASLPADVQQAIEETTGEALLDKVGEWWDKWDAAGREDAIARGNEVIEVDDATREAWREQLEPMITQYLDSLEAEGVENPRALYERTQELVAQYAPEQ
ncbi:MAG TPA: TRAP transporter substrate-binding protein [Afifellaceae bacterium]|nr:TRAP transporter substrate-binding protein [Afifellaceae bacterium]